MEESSMSIIEKIEQRRLKTIEALNQELKSLDEVEKSLNVHYQQSVTNVLNSLRHSMDTQEKELIKSKMNEALDLINPMIEETVLQSQKKMQVLQSEMTKVHQGMIKEEKQILQYMQNLNQKITQMQAKQWIIPTVMGLSIVLALVVGTWGVSQYLSSQILALQELKETIHQTKQIQDKYIKKAWSNAVGVKSKPKIWEDQKSGLWIVQYEKAE